MVNILWNYEDLPTILVFILYVSECLFLLMDFCLYSPKIRNLLHAHFASRPSGLGSFPSPSCHTLGIIRANLYKLGHGNRGAVWVVPGIQHLPWGIMGPRVKSWLPCASIAIFSLYTTKLCWNNLAAEYELYVLRKDCRNTPQLLLCKIPPSAKKRKRVRIFPLLTFETENQMVLIGTQRCTDLC